VIPTTTAAPVAVAVTPVVRRVTPQPPMPEATTATAAQATPHATLTPTPTLGPDQQLSPVDGARLVYLAAGFFWMGSSETDLLTEPDELPQRRVRLEEFWIDQTEVTNAQYAQCVAAGACAAPPPELEPGDALPYYGSPDFRAYPVANVSWEEAAAYCAWAGRRLPTEAEWERAARGRDARTHPWGWFGFVMDDRLNFCDRECPYPWADASLSDGFARTAPVGSYPNGASPSGAHDMAGNVWEWVSDWYAGAAYSTEPNEQPLGPAQGRYKVVRGGSWLDSTLGDRLSFFRAANRHWQLPDARRSYIGFRCATSTID
jgi:formylglycine-generating enzyme required for sulfatase activity